MQTFRKFPNDPTLKSSTHIIKVIDKVTQPPPSQCWVTSRQPQTLQEVVGNPELIEILSRDNLPNLLFSGPNGCGKTSVARLIIKKALTSGPSSALFEASGALDVDVDNLCEFLERSIRLPLGQYRIVLITDFDCLANDTQLALRRLIEVHSHHARFILICNQLNQVCEAIHSRTLSLKFSRISNQEICTELQRLSNFDSMLKVSAQDVNMKLEAIALLANGDLRKAVNLKQTDAIDTCIIKHMKDILLLCQSRKLTEAIQSLSRLVYDGYNSYDILDLIIRILSGSDLTKAFQAHVIEIVIITALRCEKFPSTTHLYSMIVKLCRYT
jgi:replication factor C small subunit